MYMQKTSKKENNIDKKDDWTKNYEKTNNENSHEACFVLTRYCGAWSSSLRVALINWRYLLLRNWSPCPLSFSVLEP